MDITRSLFEGKKIRLGSIDHEKDPEVESRWTQDAEYQRGLGQAIARPLSPAQVKKNYEAIEKQAEESKNLFYFTIRSRETGGNGNSRLLGFARLFWIEWSHGTGSLQVAIGDPQERRHGYGSEALRLLLNYAFSELNLYRLSGVVAEDNLAALGMLKKAGFIEEVRRRKAIQRDGRTWDLLHLGLLGNEWSQQ